MNDNFLIPDQSSLFNIKSIYNTMIEKLGEGGFENKIINPSVTESVRDSANNQKMAGWEFYGMPSGPGNHVINIGDYIRQDVCYRLSDDSVHTLILDVKISGPIQVSIRGHQVGMNHWEPLIQDINYSDPNDFQTDLVKIIEPQFDEFGHEKRFQVSFNLNVVNIPSILAHAEVFLTFAAAPIDPLNPPTQPSTIEFFNVALVKGLFGVSIEKKQGFFTDYVRYNIFDACYEASMDDGETYHRILTTRPEDIDAFVQILVTNGIIYTKNDCDMMFLRKDIPDTAGRTITFEEGLISEDDAIIGGDASLLLEGGKIRANTAQITGSPENNFSLMVDRGAEWPVGIRYNESIDRWQFTHDGIDWKIMGSGEGGAGTGTGSSELEYYAEILDKTPYAFGYYDLFDEIDQADSVITQNLNWSSENSLYKVEDYPGGPWYVTTRNMWNPDHAGNLFSFFVHPLTNKTDNDGVTISYSLVGSGGGDPLSATDPGWIPIDKNDIIIPASVIDEMYFKFELDADDVQFHSFGVFYGSWNYSIGTYTRLREYFVASSTNQIITVPNAGSYTIGEKALELYLNRVRQILDVDYTETDLHTVQMLVPVNSGDVIEFYEKYTYADLSSDNTILMNTHIADTGVHVDSVNVLSRISTLEDWQTNFTELDPAALAAISTHVSDTSNPHVVTAAQIGAALDGHNHDLTYLGIAGKAADSDKLDSHDSTYFAVDGHNHDLTYLGIGDKAADSDKLDSHDSTYFAVDGHNHVSADITDLVTTIQNNTVGLGIAQTWQDVTASRSANVSYQNTTSKPIAIKVRATGDDIFPEISTNGSVWVTFLQSSVLTGQMVIVPENHYFRLRTVNPITIYYWTELR